MREKFSAASRRRYISRGWRVEAFLAFGRTFTKETGGGCGHPFPCAPTAAPWGEGDLFFCIAGTHADGHLFAKEALKRGAAAFVTEHELPLPAPQLIVPDSREAMARIAAAFCGHPERKLKLVAVTGTNGKTTTAHLLFHILEAAEKRAGLIGTLGARFQDTVIAPELTTPDPFHLFPLLKDMAEAGAEYVVMEVSAHALALRKECPIVYDAAVFTNLTRDHLDFFGSMERYGAAKAKLFQKERCRLAVLNADDAFSGTLAKGGMPCITYGLESPADCFAVVEEKKLRSSRVVFNLSDELVEARLRLVGRHNVYNALAAAAAAKALGLSSDAVSRGISSTQEVDGRLEWVASYNGADIFVDFAHTPDGLEKSVTALKEECKGRLILLFGCDAALDCGKRAVMGEVAASLADFSVLTSDNPRYEDPVAIIAEIEKGYREVSDRYVAVEEREKAIEYALTHLKAGDILLVAGKGGETTQEIMGIKYRYNDKAVIKAALERL